MIEEESKNPISVTGKVLITGATGFIGSHIAKALYNRGYRVVACVRDEQLAIRLNPDIDYIKCNFADDSKVEVWLPRLAGVDVIINAVGIITESSSGTFQSVHTDTPKALFDACKLSGVKHVIQISALGVSGESNTSYNNTKKEADDYLLSLGIHAIVLRPSWLYGKNSQSFELLSAFSALPFIPVVGNGEYKVQPIYIEDFASAVAILVEDNSLDGDVVEVGGVEKISIKNIHKLLCEWLGLKTIHFLKTPEWFVKIFVKLGDYVFKGPINTASFDMLTRNNITDDNRLWKATKIIPNHMKYVLSQYPASKQEQLSARLFFAMPLLRYSLAFLWLATAIITGFLTPKIEAMQLFFEAKIIGNTANILFYSSLIVDFLLGLSLLFNYRLRFWGIFQIILIIFYTLFISVFSPHWWLHPYGAIIKNIPIIAATIIVIAVSRSR